MTLKNPSEKRKDFYLQSHASIDEIKTCLVINSVTKPIWVCIYCFVLILYSNEYINPTYLHAGDMITSKIRVIHATSEAPLDAPHFDSGLNDLANQLQSVFKYTSYHLIDSHEITIANNTAGFVSLPGERTLEIVSGGISGDRLKFTIRILKNKSQVFMTQILLKNGNSVTIGGPDYKKGYLLFNISGLSD